jgi:hypothetical protein
VIAGSAAVTGRVPAQLVQLEVALGGRVIENSSARPARRHEPVAQHGVVEDSPQRRLRRFDIVGRDQQRVDVGARDVAISLDRRGDDRRSRRHPLEQDDAERFAV